eukprot:jgi/Mesen1/4295/ME000022S03587
MKGQLKGKRKNGSIAQSNFAPSALPSKHSGDHSVSEDSFDRTSVERSDFKEYSDSEDEGQDDYKKGGYHPVKVGDIFKGGRYRVEKKLGWGHFSTVWLAFDNKSKTSVALKIQKSALHYTESALDEIVLLKQVAAGDPENEKGVVRLLDHFKHLGPYGTHVCMVFEHLGDNLLTLIKRHNFRGIPLAQVKELSRRILVGLDYLHRQLSIIHTDLKPENVLLLKELRAQGALPAANGKGPRESGWDVLPPGLDSSKALLPQGPPAEQQHLQAEGLAMDTAVQEAGKGGSKGTGIPGKAGGGLLTKNQKKKKKRKAKKAHGKPGAAEGAGQGGEEFDDSDSEAEGESALLGAGGQTVVEPELVSELAAVAAPSVSESAPGPLHLHSHTKGVVSEQAMPSSNGLAAAHQNGGCLPEASEEPELHSPVANGDVHGAQGLPLGAVPSAEAEALLDGVQDMEATACLPLPPPPPLREEACGGVQKAAAAPSAPEVGSAANGASGRAHAGVEEGEEELQTDLGCKIVDLGNACWTYKQFTSDIQTRQYRCPEVLLGSKYSTPADMWSFACIVFELATGDVLFDPRSGEDYDRDEDHLALMMELLGRMPRKVALGGRYSKDFFTRHGELRHIRRLRFWPLDRVLVEKYEFSEQDAAEMDAFLRPFLDLVPENRATAQQALSHPWLLNSRSLGSVASAPPVSKDGGNHGAKIEADGKERRFQQERGLVTEYEMESDAGRAQGGRGQRQLKGREKEKEKPNLRAQPKHRGGNDVTAKEAMARAETAMGNVAIGSS